MVLTFSIIQIKFHKELLVIHKDMLHFPYLFLLIIIISNIQSFTIRHLFLAKFTFILIIIIEVAIYFQLVL